jgi:hypothetical protein
VGSSHPLHDPQIWVSVLRAHCRALTIKTIIASLFNLLTKTWSTGLFFVYEYIEIRERHLLARYLFIESKDHIWQTHIWQTRSRQSICACISTIPNFISFVLYVSERNVSAKLKLRHKTPLPRLGYLSCIWMQTSCRNQMVHISCMHQFRTCFVQRSNPIISHGCL